jgi:hypothetical protein
LKNKLQSAIDASDPVINTIILGYGLCSQAVVGLKSERFTLVIPKTDDCIGIFLGSQTLYLNEHRNEPGTYYLTKGWLETGGTPFHEFDNMVKKYGIEKAKRIMNQMLGNYKRIVFINTGLSELDKYRAEAKAIADRFGLRYEEMEGSDKLIRKMISGTWDDNFVIVKPGHTLAFMDFRY